LYGTVVNGIGPVGTGAGGMKGRVVGDAVVDDEGVAVTGVAVGTTEGIGVIDIVVGYSVGGEVVLRNVGATGEGWDVSCGVVGAESGSVVQ
jgi:hypothetical protein